MFITPANCTHVIINTSTGETSFFACEMDAYRMAKKMKMKLAPKKKSVIAVQTIVQFVLFAESVQV